MASLHGKLVCVILSNFCLKGSEDVVLAELDSVLESYHHNASGTKNSNAADNNASVGSNSSGTGNKTGKQ